MNIGVLCAHCRSEAFNIVAALNAEGTLVCKQCGQHLGLLTCQAGEFKITLRADVVSFGDEAESPAST